MSNSHWGVTVPGTLLMLLAGNLGAAATPRLESIAVTPPGPSISVGQVQPFVATGTFSNGSKTALGPDISSMALGLEHTCASLTSGGAECWGANDKGQLGNGKSANSLIPQPVQKMNLYLGLGI